MSREGGTSIRNMGADSQAQATVLYLLNIVGSGDSGEEYDSVSSHFKRPLCYVIIKEMGMREPYLRQ